MRNLPTIQLASLCLALTFGSIAYSAEPKVTAIVKLPFAFTKCR